MKRTIRMKQNFSFDREQVWLALTDSNLLGQWFMKNDFRPEINFEFTFRMVPQKGWDGITHCKIIEIAPLQKLVYTYKGSATGEKTLSCAGIHSETADKAAKGIFTELDTILSFTLTPICGGTNLFMEHSGFQGFKLVLISFVFGMGWKKQMKKLGTLLEKLEREKPITKKISLED